MTGGIDRIAFNRLRDRNVNDGFETHYNRIMEFLRQNSDRAFHTQEVGRSLGFPDENLMGKGPKQQYYDIMNILDQLVDEGFVEMAKDRNAKYYIWRLY